MSQSVTANRAESSAVDARNAHAQDFEKKAFRFRILVVGRANAGKTTILQKVCNTTEEPEIYDAKGKKIESSVLAPTPMRGQHDIKNEMVLLSNPGLVFHDSRGFEAGGVDELDAVKAFIAERSQKRKLLDQLHAICRYCIPVDDSRPFTRAEINFFSECGTGHAYQELEDEGIPWEDAQIQVPT